VTWGWQYGYWLATAMGLLGIVLVFFFMADSPESRGFAPVNSKPQIDTQAAASSVASIQWLLLKSPALWLLALASCLMYVGRYAVNSWGVFFLENAKHYDTLSASTLISVASICGIAGTGLSGLISDRFFAGRRHGLAIAFGAMNAAGLALFLYGPAGHYWLDVLAMVVFGTSLGALLCFLGGLMAVDIAGKAAAGAALGMIGIVSYIGAAAGEMLTGVIIEHGTTLSATGAKLYDFNTLSRLWVGAAIASVLMTCLLSRVARRRPKPLPLPALQPET
jgi:MFS transporter, OPA family, sugar phosphate sensor protein UhpC